MNSGIQIVEENPDVVLIAFDTELNYERLSKACSFISNGCEFLATHLNLNCPTDEGFIPDCGAMCALITASRGKAEIPWKTLSRDGRLYTG